jgi:hypothetical protein
LRKGRDTGRTSFRMNGIQEVRGSTPLGSTKFVKKFQKINKPVLRKIREVRRGTGSINLDGPTAGIRQTIAHAERALRPRLESADDDRGEGVSDVGLTKICDKHGKPVWLGQPWSIPARSTPCWSLAALAGRSIRACSTNCPATAPTSARRSKSTSADWASPSRSSRALSGTRRVRIAPNLCLGPR